MSNPFETVKNWRGDVHDVIADVDGSLAETNQEIYNTWFEVGTAAGVPTEAGDTIAAIKDVSAAPLTIVTFTSSTLNWTVPDCTEMMIIICGGGTHGTASNISGSSNTRFPGGAGAGMTGYKLDVSSLPAAFDIAVGAAGSPGTKSYVRAANGSHTGTVVVESPAAGVIGGIPTPLGYVALGGQPGKGGRGGSYNTGEDGITTNGENGVGNSINAGGTGSTGSRNSGADSLRDGGAGGSLSVGSTIRAGGGGGGGGQCGTANFFTPFNGGDGGAGGWPGAGGGGGGHGSAFGGVPGSGGAGAAGVVWIHYR